MEVFDSAEPLLRQAHRLMFDVAEQCCDEPMIELLKEAMEANREAQARVRFIALRAAEIDG